MPGIVFPRKTDTIPAIALALLQQLQIPPYALFTYPNIQVDKILEMKQPDVIAGIGYTSYQLFKVREFEPFMFPYVIPNRLPEPKPTENINSIATAAYKLLALSPILPFQLPTIKVNEQPRIKFPEKEIPIPTLPKENIAKIQHNRHIRELTIEYVFNAYKQRSVFAIRMLPPPSSTDTVVAITKPKIDTTTVIKKPTAPPPPIVVAPKPKTVVDSALPLSKAKELDFHLDTAVSQETTVEVYFTDGKGRYFKTTPQVILLDPVTQKEVQKFTRWVNSIGLPDPQKGVPPGTYNLTIGNKRSLVVNDVHVYANKNNKITVKVTKGSLSFRYRNNHDKPVNEYYAVVKHIIDAGPTIKQPCTAVLPYEPAMYHVEVNTLPVTKYAVDLDFDTETVLEVDEPGNITFTNTNNLGKVQLYCPLGDKFLQFYEITIAGNPTTQKLSLKPGVYQAHFSNPAFPNASPTSLTFHIKSNETTELELR
jgi:hypothetical protein